MTAECPTEFLRFAETLAEAARPIIQRHFRRPLDIVDKPDASPVTVADRDAEAAVRALIEKRYPDHGIYGEEHGQVRLDARHVWVIDPIDGTKAFITGMPVFGTLIALCDRGRPILGVIDQPVLDERWLGADGHGATLNGRPIRTSACTRLAEASVYTTTPDMFATDEARRRYERIETAARLRRFGGDCYATGLLAAGHVDLVVEAQLSPYDYMALVPVVENAGGRATDWAGRALDFSSNGEFLAAATPALHAEAQALLGG